MTIRTAKISDIDAIMKIEREAFDVCIQEKESVFLERIELFNDGFFVLEEDGFVCGYFSSELWNFLEERTEADFSLGHDIGKCHSNSGDELYISSFALLQEMRGKGAGKYLFHEAIKRILAKYSLKSIILLVSASWQNAEKMYSESGFNYATRLSDFFQFSDGGKADGKVLRKRI